MRADRAFFDYWRGRYLSESSPGQIEEEEDLLRRVGPLIRRRGYYTVSELRRVNRWKLPTERNRTWLARNSHHRVRAVTQRALAAPEDLQLYTLQLLHGVSAAVASALLIFPFPERHTVIDFRVARALEALDKAGQLSDELLWRQRPPSNGSWLPPYPAYLDACRRLAARHQIGLRDLDRALWQWHRETSGRSAR
ncbi:MAG TPA: hypothetical protein VFL29_04310 [Candidatus Dormibacteraeota bacterium]|nr:hypothetical protein [Candidatus Dormibacteraeota bacterium]